MSPDVDVAVVGAGMAGLAAAYALRKAGRSVHVFEASDRVGGRMATVHLGGFRVDTGATRLPDRGRRATWGLLRELGLRRRQVPHVGGAVGVWRGGRVHVLGVAHPFGWLTGGASSMGRTYREGMDSLARALADRLAVSTGVAIREVIAEPGQARLVADGATLNARCVVLAVPAPVAARLFANPPAQERAYLDACEYAPAVRVSCLLDRPLTLPAGRPLHTLLVSAVDDHLLAGLLVDHVRNPALVPAGHGSITLLASPVSAPYLLDLPDDAEVAGRLAAAAERYLPGLAAATLGRIVHRFRAGLPDPTPAALRLRPDFAQRDTSSVDFAGDWVLLQPSGEAAVRAGLLAAERVLARPAHRCPPPALRTG